MAIELAILLVLIALVAGVGITTIGPGGIFVTIALFLLLPIDPATVAGTASTTFVATGVMGSLSYLRSGELGSGHARELAIVLSVTAIGGAAMGTRLNLLLSERVFGITLAAFVAGIGVVLVLREAGWFPHVSWVPTAPTPRRLVFGIVGTGVGIAGGMLGVGGPVLAVPVLVVLGVPMLVGLAVAQVQSIVLAGAAAIGYAAVGAISWPLVVLVGVPQVVGVYLGWRVAHAVPERRLRVALGIVLVVIAPFIVP